MHNRRLLDVSDIVVLVKDLPGDRSNPTGDKGRTCLYTDPNDPSMHCIAGEIVSRLGWDLPDPLEDSYNNSTGFLSLYHEFDYPLTEDAADIIEALQRYADEATTSSGFFKDKAWGYARDVVFEEYHID